MSANNQLHIYKSEKHNLWIVTDVCVESENMDGAYTIGGFKTLEEAIDIANEYMKENEVEYGLRIVTPASQDNPKEL